MNGRGTPVPYWKADADRHRNSLRGDLANIRSDPVMSFDDVISRFQTQPSTRWEDATETVSALSVDGGKSSGASSWKPTA